MSKEIFIKMREEEYFEIPQEIRERYLSSKNVTSENNDWSENMQDPKFAELYASKKKAKEQLEEWQYILRENRRKGSEQSIIDSDKTTDFEFDGLI